MSNNNTPVWTVNSEEMGSAITILLLLTFIPVLPMVLLGLYLANKYIGVNFALWGASIFMYVLSNFIILYLYAKKGKLYAIGFILLQYLIMDIVTTYTNPTSNELQIITWIKKFIAWGMTSI